MNRKKLYGETMRGLMLAATEFIKDDRSSEKATMHASAQELEI